MEIEVLFTTKMLSLWPNFLSICSLKLNFNGIWSEFARICLIGCVDLNKKNLSNLTPDNLIKKICRYKLAWFSEKVGVFNNHLKLRPAKKNWQISKRFCFLVMHRDPLSYHDFSKVCKWNAGFSVTKRIVNFCLW